MKRHVEHIKGCRSPKGRPGIRWCCGCRAAYTRAWRKLHPLNAEQRRRATARSYAGVYLRRGKIEKKPCVICGSPESQMHHEDYRQPLNVTWLCRTHHLALHRRTA